jgi:hypothetical protein
MQRLAILVGIALRTDAFSQNPGDPMLRLFLRLYAVAVVLIAGWAWMVEISMRHSQVEHLLPSVLLMTVTLPISLGVGPLLTCFPSAFDGPFIPMVVLTVAGLLQVGLLLAAEYLISQRRPTKAR